MLNEEKRRWPRKTLAAEVGVVRSCSPKEADIPRPGQSSSFCFVGVRNCSVGGLLVESTSGLEPDLLMDLARYDLARKEWRTNQARVAWTGQAPGGHDSLVGLEFLPRADSLSGSAVSETLLADLEFLLQTDLLKSIPGEAVWRLLDCLVPRILEAGHCFTVRADKGVSLYIIQNGTGVIRVEMDGALRQEIQLSSGDLVDEMALLACRQCHIVVEAETNLVLWQLGRKQLADFVDAYPQINDLLTRSVPDLQESFPPIDDRASSDCFINQAVMDNYIMRIYRRGGATSGRMVGIVEKVETGEMRSFNTLDGLQQILVSPQEQEKPDPDGGNNEDEETK